MSGVDFEEIARLRGEYFNVFLDSQMNIADRMRWADEVPKILGNFDRLHREVREIFELLNWPSLEEDRRTELRQSIRCCSSCDAMRRLKALAYPEPAGEGRAVAESR